MKKEKLEGMLIDLIDGRLNETERKEVEQLLSSDPDAAVLYEQLKQVTNAMDQSKELEPSTQLRLRFQQMLAEEERSLSPHRSGKGRQILFQPVVVRMAAAVALVLAGVAIGYYINRNQRQQEELVRLNKEMEQTKRLMIAMLDNQQSASKRIEGVNVALTIEEADDEVVKALVKAMSEDPNSNVRLAALEALSKFQYEPQVRKALIESLAVQKDPVVQIALIQLMVEMKEKGVINDLKRIIDDVHTIKPVKDEAYTGLLELS